MRYKGDGTGAVPYSILRWCGAVAVRDGMEAVSHSTLSSGMKWPLYGMAPVPSRTQSPIQSENGGKKMPLYGTAPVPSRTA